MSNDSEKIRKGDGRRKRGHRSGFTTGACAAAAARAATLGLLTGEVPASIHCALPNGQDVDFPVHAGHVGGDTAHAVIVKDAGDDPDATNGAHLTAHVRRLPLASGQIVLKGGAGVGTVTKEGLGLEVGGPAINPVPRRNIEANVRAVADWAAQNGLPTIDVYSGWPVDQGQRDALLEADGSPTLEGSRLFARIVAEALAPA